MRLDTSHVGDVRNDDICRADLIKYRRQTDSGHSSIPAEEHNVLMPSFGDATSIASAKTEIARVVNDTQVRMVSRQFFHQEPSSITAPVVDQQHFELGESAIRNAGDLPNGFGNDLFLIECRNNQSDCGATIAGVTSGGFVF